jgi:LacI family transcriptional regulator
MPRVTLEQIAERAGTDRGTVSRVLNGKAAQFHIGKDVAARVQAIATELNYIPNAFARAVRLGRFGSAALLMSTDARRSYLPRGLLDGIHDELASVDMHLTIAKMPDDQLNSTDYLPKILRTLMADGLLINYTHHLPPHLIAAVENGWLPAVWINTDHEFDAVYPDNRAAARSTTEILLQAGHRRIGYVDMFHVKEMNGTAHFSARDRATGYREAMQAAGLAPLEIRPETPSLPETWDAVLLPILRGPERPTALLCYSAAMVPATLRAAAECRLRVPDDLAIAAFGKEDFEQKCFGVSLMCEPEYNMGREAVQLLLEKIKEPRGRLPSRVLEFYWIGPDVKKR